MASQTYLRSGSAIANSKLEYLETNMEPNRVALRRLAPLEDPLEYLPCSQIAEYQKGQVIYNQSAPSTNIYLILEGRVKVSCLADRGRQVLVNIYQTEEFFGESASYILLNAPRTPSHWKTPSS